MTKRDKKEKALLLLSYAFMKLLFDNYKNQVNLDEITKYDLEFERIYKKLSNIHRLYANDKIAKFALSRISDEINKNCDLPLVAILILYWFKRLNLSKKVVFTENLEELTAAIAYSLDEETINESVEFSAEIVAGIYPDQKGLIEFRRFANKFPFDLIRRRESVSM